MKITTLALAAITALLLTACAQERETEVQPGAEPAAPGMVEQPAAPGAAEQPTAPDTEAAEPAAPTPTAGKPEVEVTTTSPVTAP